MFFDYLKITGSAVSQIFILGLVGYVLVKRNILGEEGLRALSRLVIEIIFPVLVFVKITGNFSFSLYPNWWIFPLLSIAITITALLIGSIFVGLIKGEKHKIQFLNLIAFQNSGYLPLALIAGILAAEQASSALIYLFLFLLGFDLVMWSLGVYMLTSTMAKKFELGSMFSPPVIANIVSLVVVFIGLNKFIPQLVMKPLATVGDCALPLAMFVVGGNLASIHLGAINKKAISLILLAKLFLLPALGLWVVLRFKFPALIGLFIVMQLAMPSATSLSVIIRHYRKEDLIISQGIFFSHIVSLITIPVFLSLYFMLSVLK